MRPAGESVLCWGVKASFMQYLATTPGGQVSIGGGAGYADSGEFVFPATGVVDADAGSPGVTHRFGGDVRFVGHGGLLHVELADPWIETRGDVTTLSFVHTSAPTGTPARIGLVRLQWQPPGGGDDPHGWRTAAARLLPAACGVFDDVYVPDEPMATVRVRTGAARVSARVTDTGADLP